MIYCREIFVKYIQDLSIVEPPIAQGTTNQVYSILGDTKTGNTE